jgi:hypothetical protein
MYILSYIGNKPHWDSNRVKLEVFNEIMILVACYHLICFSEFIVDSDTQFNMGYSFVALIVCVIVFNVTIVVYKQYTAL